ncbi:MAG: peptide ABC transporter substrate-binding protein [Acetobacteraceae bacterium]|nr:peptide ABC transporter substrate-binding protein [Acetobacteraceae bacterium]
MFKFAAFLLALLTAGSALAQTPRSGGTLRIYQRDNPASASIHEEATYSTTAPFMGVFNNLVLNDQHIPRTSMDTIRPELATSWTWSEDGQHLTFRLREGVTWHDGKPFTSADVKCTFDLLREKAADKFRKNPRKPWYQNVADVTTNGPLEATIHLSRRQPSILAMLASGFTPMYPCHVPQIQMRSKPIGTGPYMSAEFKQNEILRFVKNPHYWKPGLPYLDGIDWPIIANRSTAILAFEAGKIDMTFPWEVSVPIRRDILAHVPNAICHFGTMNVNYNLIVNGDKPPFDNLDIRRAMALTIDRKAFIDILFEGQADIGGSLMPGPEGVWGMPDDMKKTMLGFGPDVAANRAQAKAIMEKLGYGPKNRLAVKVSIRNIPYFRDPAVILIDHLKEAYIDGELDPVDTAIWYPKLYRKDYAIGLNLTGNSMDDPDQTFYENFGCKSDRNYSGYCNPEVEALFDRQSVEVDFATRRALVWEIDQRLQNEVARPVILHQHGGTCWHKYVRGYTPMTNSPHNGYRFEDMWIDR